MKWNSPRSSTPARSCPSSSPGGCGCSPSGSVVALEAVEADQQPRKPVSRPDAQPAPPGLLLPAIRRNRRGIALHRVLEARAQLQGEGRVIDEYVRLPGEQQAERIDVRGAH